MSVGKELLLSCIVMMHILFMNSQSIDFVKLRKNMERMDDFSVFNYLEMADAVYVKHLFGGERPYKLKLMKGISLENTTEHLQTSVCAIVDYLDKHLPKIMSHFHSNGIILNNTNAFLFHFNDAVNRSRSDQNETSASIQCHRNVTEAYLFALKVRGLTIINSTMRWVETFTGKHICHMCKET